MTPGACEPRDHAFPAAGGAGTRCRCGATIKGESPRGMYSGARARDFGAELDGRSPGPLRFTGSVGSSGAGITAASAIALAKHGRRR